MRVHMNATWCWSAAAVACMAGAPLAAADAFVLGGFSTARGGTLAIAGGSALTQMRSSISAAFPGTTYSGAPVLTSEYLAGIDILFISSATTGNSAIVPLSASEIAAVRQFIDRGGTAVLVAENDTYGGPSSDAANESVIDAVGVDVVGTGFPGLVAFPSHSLAACSGAVVVFSDVTAFFDGYYTPGSANDTLMLNTIAYVAAPSCTVGLCGDTDGNGQIDGADLGALLARWGSGDRAADLDASGTVDGADLGILLTNWGACSN